MGNQVQNGKAFEYALAKVYYDEINAKGLLVTIIEDAAYNTAKGYFEGFSTNHQNRYIASAQATIDTMLKIEPGLTAQKDNEDILTIRLATDAEGQAGDVRDVIFTRNRSHWEIGFSAKNNNDSQKHSRISGNNDIGEKWFGLTCSDVYWEEVRTVFEFVKKYKDNGMTWDDMGVLKETQVYIPLLNAFRKEILKIDNENPKIPEKLISYVIGTHPFYQVIKLDSKNLVVVKAFNIGGGLNKTVNRKKSRYGIPVLEPPTRIVELEFAPSSDNHMNDTLYMILDKGWEVSFRIHSADNPIVLSCKFDVKLLGNPPILFSQYLFQD